MYLLTNSELRSSKTCRERLWRFWMTQLRIQVLFSAPVAKLKHQAATWLPMNTTFFVYNLGGAAGSTDVPVEPAVLISAACWQLQSVKYHLTTHFVLFLRWGPDLLSVESEVLLSHQSHPRLRLHMEVVLSYISIVFKDESNLQAVHHEVERAELPPLDPSRTALRAPMKMWGCGKVNMLNWGQKGLQAEMRPAECKAKAKAKAKNRAVAVPPNPENVVGEHAAESEPPAPAVPVPDAGVYSMRRHKRKTVTGEVKIFAIQSAGKQCAQLTTSVNPDAERIIGNMVSELNEKTTTLECVMAQLNQMKGNVWDALMYESSLQKSRGEQRATRKNNSCGDSFWHWLEKIMRSIAILALGHVASTKLQ